MFTLHISILSHRADPNSSFFSEIQRVWTMGKEIRSSDPHAHKSWWIFLAARNLHLFFKCLCMWPHSLCFICWGEKILQWRSQGLIQPPGRTGTLSEKQYWWTACTELFLLLYIVIDFFKSPPLPSQKKKKRQLEHSWMASNANYLAQVLKDSIRKII